MATGGSVLGITQQRAVGEKMMSLYFDTDKNTLKIPKIQARIWVFIGITSEVKRLVPVPAVIQVNQPAYADTKVFTFKEPFNRFFFVTATRDLNKQLLEPPALNITSP